MGREEFIEKCKTIVKKYTIEHFEKIADIPEFDVLVVWYGRTTQDIKALLNTTLSDGMYYEITYDGEKKEFCLNAYEKVENKYILLEEE